MLEDEYNDFIVTWTVHNIVRLCLFVPIHKYVTSRAKALDCALNEATGSQCTIISVRESFRSWRISCNTFHRRLIFSLLKERELVMIFFLPSLPLYGFNLGYFNPRWKKAKCVSRLLSVWAAQLISLFLFVIKCSERTIGVSLRDRERVSQKSKWGGTLPALPLKRPERCVYLAVGGDFFLSLSPAYLLWRGGPEALIGSPTGERKWLTSNLTQSSAQ